MFFRVCERELAQAGLPDGEQLGGAKSHVICPYGVVCLPAGRLKSLSLEITPRPMKVHGPAVKKRGGFGPERFGPGGCSSKEGSDTVLGQAPVGTGVVVLVVVLVVMSVVVVDNGDVVCADEVVSAEAVVTLKEAESTDVAASEVEVAMVVVAIVEAGRVVRSMDVAVDVDTLSVDV